MSGERAVFTDKRAGSKGLSGERTVFTDKRAGNKGLSGERTVFTDKRAGNKGLSGERTIFTDKRAGSKVLSGERAVFTDKRAGSKGLSGERTVFTDKRAGSKGLSGKRLVFTDKRTGSKVLSGKRAVYGLCCRLKSDYSYTVKDVYNNFPWPIEEREGLAVPEGYPAVTAAQREKIERTAQGILDARAAYPDCSLADLYDSLTMPPELRRAHRANDAAVLEAYGFPPAAPESDLVSRLFDLYRRLT